MDNIFVGNKFVKIASPSEPWNKCLIKENAMKHHLKGNKKIKTSNEHIRK